MAMDIKTEAKKADFSLELPSNAKDADKRPAKGHATKGVKTLVTVIIVVVVLVVIGFLVNQYTAISLFGDKGYSASLKYNKDAYHAVFLSNDQVYFGKIADRNDKSTLLEDIYYLQASNPLQQVPPSGTDQQPQLILVKLGNELHGPQDYMNINNSQIVFIEELKDSGKVVQAILQYKIGNTPAATQ